MYGSMTISFSFVGLAEPVDLVPLSLSRAPPTRCIIIIKQNPFNYGSVIFLSL